jgi:hypothetical protein
LEGQHDADGHQTRKQRQRERQTVIETDTSEDQRRQAIDNGQQQQASEERTGETGQEFLQDTPCSRLSAIAGVSVDVRI